LPPWKDRRRWPRTSGLSSGTFVSGRNQCGVNRESTAACSCRREGTRPKDYWLALHAYSVGGAYVNMVMDEGEDMVTAAYGNNYARLAHIKATYDPKNLFHVNQNIKPAV
jgi:hypothetical protein